MPDWIVSLPDRLDAFLAAEGRMPSRAKAQKAIEEGRVSINGNVVTKAAQRLQEGDLVRVQDSEIRVQDFSIHAVDLDLSILYEDDTCLVIDKPAGIAVHPGAGMVPGETTLLSGIAHLFTERSLRFSPESVLVHRLDKETTGCLLVAKTAEAHRALQRQFESRLVRKTYLALVAGVPEHPEATVDSPIGRHANNRTQMTVFQTSGAAREARTTYRVLASNAASPSTGLGAALLQCDLHTGRTHQIRVHLSSIGHPVLGDGTYTNHLSERLAQEYEIRSLCLHAWKLRFTSPEDEKGYAVEAPIPVHFLRSVESAGLQWPNGQSPITK